MKFFCLFVQWLLNYMILMVLGTKTVIVHFFKNVFVFNFSICFMHKYGVWLKERDVKMLSYVIPSKSWPVSFVTHSQESFQFTLREPVRFFYIFIFLRLKHNIKLYWLSRPVGWSCWIYRLHLNKKTPTPTSALDMTLNNLRVTLQS